MVINKGLLILACSLLLFSCVDNKSITGIYVNKIDVTNNIDTLKIYENGTYERFIYDKIDRNLLFKNNGSWKIYNSKVVLDNFLENYGGYSSKNILGDYDKYLITYYFLVEHNLEGLCLRFDYERKGYFLKE